MVQRATLWREEGAIRRAIEAKQRQWVPSPQHIPRTVLFVSCCLHSQSPGLFRTRAFLLLNHLVSLRRRPACCHALGSISFAVQQRKAAIGDFPRKLNRCFFNRQIDNDADSSIQHTLDAASIESVADPKNVREDLSHRIRSIHSLGSTGSLSRASTPKTHSWTLRSGSCRTKRSNASRPSANSRRANDRLPPRLRLRRRGRFSSES